MKESIPNISNIQKPKGVLYGRDLRRVKDKKIQIPEKKIVVAYADFMNRFQKGDARPEDFGRRARKTGGGKKEPKQPAGRQEKNHEKAYSDDFTSWWLRKLTKFLTVLKKAGEKDIYGVPVSETLEKALAAEKGEEKDRETFVREFLIPLRRAPILKFLDALENKKVTEVEVFQGRRHEDIASIREKLLNQKDFKILSFLLRQYEIPVREAVRELQERERKERGKKQKEAKEAKLFSDDATRLRYLENFLKEWFDRSRIPNENKKINKMVTRFLAQFNTANTARMLNKNISLVEKNSKFEKTLLLIDNLREKLNKRKTLDPYRVETEIILGAARYGLLSVAAIILREWQRSGDLNEEGVEQLKKYKKDLTEWLSVVKCYVLQNARDKDYIATFLDTIRSVWMRAGVYEKRQMALLAGLLGEIAAFGMLQKNFASVRAASPKEDAQAKIDFFAESKTGKKYAFMVKSSEVYHGSALYPLRDMFRDEKARQKIINESANKDDVLENLQNLKRDFKKARKYMEDQGMDPDAIYLLNIDGENINKNGEANVREKSIKELGKKLEILRAS